MNSQKTDYYLQLFKTLGAPLVSSALLNNARFGGVDGKAASPQDIAQNVASLLTKCVEGGINFGPLFELEKQGDRAESMRVALTTLAATILSDIYANREKLPELSDMEALTQGLKTIKEISASFEASPQATMRLESTQAGASAGAGVDTLQSRVQIFHAFLPVIKAVRDANFGVDSQDLIKKIHGRITAKADDFSTLMQDDLDQPLSENDKSSLQRGLISALCNIYAACHEAAAKSGETSLDAVWQNFDLQAAMAEALTRSIVPGLAEVEAGSGSSASGGVSPDAAVSQVASDPAPIDVPEPPAAPPTPPVPDTPADTQTPSIFTQNQPAQPAQPAPIQPTSAPEQPPTPQPPPADAQTPSIFTQTPSQTETPPQAPVTPPAAPSATPPPAAPPAEAASGIGGGIGGGDSANPMSFFTQKPAAQTAPPAAPTAPQAPQEPGQPPAVPPVTPPPATTPPAEAASGAGGGIGGGGNADNPMSFFTQKPADSAAPPPAAPPVQPQTPPPVASPPAQETPPASAPPSGDSSNPMSFFVKKDGDNSGEG